MEVAVGAGLLAKWNVNVDACHRKWVRYFWEKVRCRALIIVCLLLVAAGAARAQSYSLHLRCSDGDSMALAEILHVPAEFREQTSALAYLQSIVPALQEKGYLAASIDSLAVLPDGYAAEVYLGQKWRWAKLSLAHIQPALLVAMGVTEAQWSGRPLSPKMLRSLSEQMLRWCEDNGYPFAQVSLDSVILADDGGVRARLVADLGKLRRIDSFIVEGDVRIDKAYLMRYLEVFEGGLYNESHIHRIMARLHDLPFLQDGTTVHVLFRTIDTKLRIRLKERRANQLNAIAGLQPNTAETGKFLFTVDALAAFQNLLGKGESFSFSYQKLQASSPRIKAEAVYPYLLGTPIGADAHFDLYFFGQQYRRTTADIGVRYSLSSQDFVRLYYRTYSNRVITPDTNYIVTYHRLPDNVDVVSGGGGLELQTSRVDYRLNPAHGFTVRINGEALQRSLRKNDGITGITDASGFDYSHLYDTITAQAYQFHVTADAAYYFSLRKRVVLKTAYSGGWMSGDRLFQNELYQLGGFRSLRGFDEGSIFANQYHIATVELRLLLSRASAVYLFSDNAWIQSRINGYTSEGIYNGFGAGTTLETATGVFTIAYGLGRSPGNPVQLRQSKIHIGYVAYF